MIKIIITGGSGFIGTNLMQYYQNKGYIVLNVDLHQPKSNEHSKAFRQQNIEDREELTKLFVEFDPNYIIHLAARTDLNGKKLDDYSSNIIGV